MCATRLTKIVADFQTSLSAIMAVGATTGTLLSSTDDDKLALPAGNYFFTIDGDNANKEHIICTLSGTALTGIKSVSRQGVQTSGTVRVHRAGSQVILTDFAIIKEIANLLDGSYPLDGSHPLIYDTDPVISDDKHLATRKYANMVANQGAAPASASTLGVSKLSTAPADSNNPIAVGDNDSRIPSAGEKAALAGTGTPSSSNKYVTENDTNLTNNIKTTGAQNVGGVKTFASIPVLPASDPVNANDAVRKAYIDGLAAVTDGSITIDADKSIIWKKVGKTYFHLFGYSISGSRIYGLRNDENTRNKIASLLGKTVSDYAGVIRFNTSGVNGYREGMWGWQWNGGAWDYTYDLNTASNTGAMNFLTTITVQ